MSADEHIDEIARLTARCGTLETEVAAKNSQIVALEHRLRDRDFKIEACERLIRMLHADAAWVPVLKDYVEELREKYDELAAAVDKLKK